MSLVHEFVSQHLEWLIGLSVTMFVGTLVLVPALVMRIPEDYFCHRKRHPVPAQHMLIKLLLTLVKNLLGGLLVISGLVMLLTPGQGLLTLLAGLMIMNYPGKFALERWLISHLRLLPALNWLRSRYGIAPLLPPSGETSSPENTP